MVEARTTQRIETSQPLTVAEFFALYGDQPAEVVNGKVVLMSPNTRPPLETAGLLYADLAAFVKPRQLGKVAIETAYVLDASENTDWVRDSRQPDVSFVAADRVRAHDEKFGKDGPWRLAPDLAVEVISPTDSYADVMEKVADYLRYGVRLVWLIDPQNRTVRIFTPDNPEGTTLRDDAILTAAPVLPEWSMPVAALFEE